MIILTSNYFVEVRSLLWMGGFRRSIKMKPYQCLLLLLFVVCTSCEKNDSKVKSGSAMTAESNATPARDLPLLAELVELDSKTRVAIRTHSVKFPLMERHPLKRSRINSSRQALAEKFSKVISEQYSISYQLLKTNSDLEKIPDSVVAAYGEILSKFTKEFSELP